MCLMAWASTDRVTPDDLAGKRGGNRYEGKDKRGYEQEGMGKRVSTDSVTPEDLVGNRGGGRSEGKGMR